MEKKFYLEGTDPIEDAFTLEEEKENGDMDEEDLKALDSIQVGETFNSKAGYQFHRTE